MAFLCPVRIRNRKKKKTDNNDKLTEAPSIGRITGSASIETLVRVGLEKEAGLGPDSKMVVLHDFAPCVDDELEVRRGQIVNVLYQENDWVYVLADGGQEGFIPHSYCAPYGSHLAELALNIRKKMPRNSHHANNNNGFQPDHSQNQLENQNNNFEIYQNAIITGNGQGMLGNMDQQGVGSMGENGGTGTNAAMHGTGSIEQMVGSHFGGQQHIMNNNSGLDPYKKSSEKEQIVSLSGDHLGYNGTSSSSDIQPFYKDPAGRYIVLYTFIARDENDVSVERGEFVTVLNKDDPDWYWILRSDGQEGFVPSGFVCPADVIQATAGKSNSTAAQNQNNSSPHNNNYSNLAPNDNSVIQLQRQPQGQGQQHPVSGSPSGQQAQNLNRRESSPGDSHPPSSPTHHTSQPANETLQQNNDTQPQYQHQDEEHQQERSVPKASQQHSAANRIYGTELVMLYDYKAQAPDDLTVKRGDWVYADLNNQTVEGWLWSYSPKTQKYGFIPKAYARPPAMTTL